jgi:hypothetical protein
VVKDKAAVIQAASKDGKALQQLVANIFMREWHDATRKCMVADGRNYPW